MILCVTPNAAVDRTLLTPGYAQGGVFRPAQQVIAAGGKGINVARVARLLGTDAICAGFLGGFSGRLVADLLAREAIPAHWTWLNAGETRTCTILFDHNANLTTVVNEAGPTVTTEDWARLGADIHSAMRGAAAVCFCGSLPPGSPTDVFGTLLETLVADGVQVWVDTSGAALQTAAVVRGVRIKINDQELGALVAAPVTSEDALVAAAAQLYAQTGAMVAITRGEQGALLLDGQGAWLAQAPSIRVVNAVGSGDSFLAGLAVALGRGEPPEIALRCAVAAGTANALSIGGGRFGLAEYERLLGETLSRAVQAF